MRHEVQGRHALLFASAHVMASNRAALKSARRTRLLLHYPTTDLFSMHCLFVFYFLFDPLGRLTVPLVDFGRLVVCESRVRECVTMYLAVGVICLFLFV